jgi:hypothetical protein
MIESEEFFAVGAEIYGADLTGCVLSEKTGE